VVVARGTSEAKPLAPLGFKKTLALLMEAVPKQK
jgi:hypothetical protein